jgi:hypothetical protein
VSCDNVQDILVRETGRFGPDIYNRVFNRSPWVKLIQRGVFPNYMGHTLSVLTYERSAPTVAEPTWLALTVNDGDLSEGGLCLPPATQIGIASTTRTYNLARRVLQGPDFCVEDIRFSFQLRDQLEAIVSILAEYAMIEWEIRDRHEYLRLVKWKVTVNAAVTETTNTTAPFFGGLPPTSILTQGLLNRWRARLLRDGAVLSALGMENGAPIMTLICSFETSEDLIFRNADIRDDLRWGQPNLLLAPFGVTKSYRGFYHLIDNYSMRGSISGGTWTETPAFTNTAGGYPGAGATKGNKTEVATAWNVAPTEISFIFDPTVLEQQIPTPITNPASQFNFDPVTYMGDFRIKNIIDRTCNPDGTILYHRGILAAGSKPVHPERGVAFLHLRCDPALNYVTTCS